MITTIAGNGQAGFSGDGGAATSAQFASGGLRGLAIAPDGTIYVADSNNRRIRKFTVGGVITTAVGTGTSNFTGDGGPATSATIGFVEGIALAPDGRLFLADFDNFRVRVVSGGNISTFAGNGNSEYSGDGGPATNAVFGYITGMARDKAGNLYLCDDFPGNRIRRIDPFGIISLVAGSNRPGFGGDGGPAAQPASFPIDVSSIRRQPLHLRLDEQPHPQGHAGGRDFNIRGHGRSGLFRRWRSGRCRTVEFAERPGIGHGG